MIYHKLLLLTLLLVEYSHQANETSFKPIDNRITSFADQLLNGHPKNSFSQFLSELFNSSVLKKKEQEVLQYFRSLLKQYDNYNVSTGIQLKRINRTDRNYLNEGEGSSVVDDIVNYAENHVITVQLHDLVEDVTNKVKRSTEILDSSERSLKSRFFGDNNGFLTGFGLGFLAFGLQKLMVPLMIGVQVVKSLMFAMFLPTILGSLGKAAIDGVKYLSSPQRYQPTGQMGHNLGQMEDFEFKDSASNYDNQQYPDTQAEGSSSLFSYAYPSYDYKQSIGVLPAPAQSSIANRYTSGTHKLNYIPNNNHHGSFYTKHSDKHGKHQDYKVFHNIPPSSLLLTNYDPFYSPLLSRMDSVFKQLGYETEACRERLICLMYKNPAKFAPYSNLISAQLSRELNELRKPSTDNPDILRFFKYMKAAKDGQDGVECSRVYMGCHDNRESISPPMVKTFNEINKLVHARKLSK